MAGTKSQHGWKRRLLEVACVTGRVELADAVLRPRSRHGVDVSSADTKTGWSPAYIAARKGHSDILDILIAAGADISVADKEGRTPLYVTAFGGHVRAAEILLQHGADVSFMNQYGMSPLNLSADQGHLELAKLFISHGASTADCDRDGWTALCSAANTGHAGIVELLLNHGADITACLHDGSSALHLASACGHLEVARILLKHGASTAVRMKEAGTTPLYMACEKGHIDTARELIANGANLSAGINGGWTALMAATRYGHADTVKLLLQSGADPATTDENGWAALALAVSLGQTEACRALIDGGADVNYGSKGQWPPLALASDKGDLDTMRILLFKGADIEITTMDGDCWTPLCVAAYSGHVEALRLLIDSGSNVNFRDEAGWTPVGLAACLGHEEVIKVLADAGADLSIPNHRGATLLHGALWNEREGAARLILDQYVDASDVDAVDEVGCTPLMAAVTKGNTEIATTLIERGADTSRRDGVGWTLLHRAAVDGHVKLIDEFITRGLELDAMSNELFTPLHLASHNGHANAVSFLLDKEADTTTKNVRGQTPLISATIEGKLEAVKVLLSKGADVTATDDNGRGVLAFAAFNGHLDIVQLLLEDTPHDLLPLVDADGTTPLVVAGINGHIDIVKYLLAKGFDPSTPREDGLTPLHLAAGAGNVEVIKVLFEHGAVMSPSKLGFVPLHSAAVGGQVDAAKILIERGADVEHVADGEFSLTPLLAAATHGCIDVMKFLLEKGASVSPGEASHYCTALHFAVAGGHLEASQWLLDIKPDQLVAADESGNTPLHAAVDTGRLDIVEVLLKAGANVKATNSDGMTPLLYSRCKDVDMVQLLLDFGADATETSATGGTALHLAALGNPVEVTKLLLDSGSHLSAADDAGSTPLLLAVSGGHIDIATELIERYADPALARRDGRQPVEASAFNTYIMLAKQNAFLHKTTGEEGEGAIDPNQPQLPAPPMASQPTDTFLQAMEESLLKSGQQLADSQEISEEQSIAPQLEAMSLSPPDAADAENSPVVLVNQTQAAAVDEYSMLCPTCRGIFEHQVGKMPLDIWYMVQAFIAKTSPGAEQFPKTNEKAPGFIHHITAHNMSWAAKEGCYICKTVWGRVDDKVREELLLKEAESTDPEDFSTPLAFAVLFDYESIFKGTPLQQPLEGDRAPKVGNVWAVAFRDDVMKKIDLGPSSLAMFTLVPEKEATELDVGGAAVMSSNTKSDESLAFALNQFKTCAEEHEECNKARDANWLPTRLIDVGEGLADTGTVRLVLTKDLERSTGYCTLSHCWGTKEFLKLKQENLDSFISEIPIESLPKTFRDSLFVARKLGLRYIWIDSICIIQDDPNDWLNEASQMHEVYANSLCNICATGSQDSSGGLFVDRDPTAFRSCDVRIPWLGDGGRFRLYDLVMWRTEVIEAPLNRRAWVVQEHLLSPRQLHFGSLQILWECLHASAAEQFPHGLPKAIPNLSHASRQQLHNIRYNANDDGDAAAASRERTVMHSSWSTIVERYMQCSLSHACDKVIAFSGIARRFEAIMKDECVAGLWRENMENGLLWHVEYCRQAGDSAPSTRPSPYRAPSFSWMSVDGAVNLISYQPPNEDEEKLIKLLSVDISESRGVIAPGSFIQLECSLRPLKLRRHVSPSGVMWLPRFRQGKPELGYGLSMANAVLMDVDRDYGDDIYYCVPAKGKFAEVFLAGIVLQETGKRVGEFERIGFFQAGGEHKQLLLSLYGDEDTYPCESYDGVTGKHIISIV